MGILTQGDPAALAERFQEWLRGKPGYEHATLTHFGQASASAGWSNETYKAVVVPRPGGAAETCIVRLPPEGESVLKVYDMALQFNTLKALEGVDGLPVVRARWLERDPGVLGRPFYLMEFVEGATADDRPVYFKSGWVVAATDAQRRRMWTTAVEAIARLASVDWRARGLDAYAWPDRTRSCIEQNLEHWTDFHAWGAAAFSPAPVPAIVVELRRWLRGNLPEEGTLSLNWGDARFANMIFRNFEPVALLDWEVAMVGDPEIDITFFLMAHRHLRLMAYEGAGEVPDLGGFLSEAETLAHYARARGAPVRHPNFYWLFNAYRIYGIRQRIASLLVKSGALDLEAALRMRAIPTLEPDVRRRMDRAPSAILEV